MADTVITTQSPAPTFKAGTFRGQVAVGISVDPGMPVAGGGDSPPSQVIFARANAANTSNVLGVAVTAGEFPGHVDVQQIGPVTLTTAQWDARTGGSGGLTPNAVYYLSAAAAGKLTTTPPTNPNYITPIGWALNAQTLILQIGVTQLAGS